MTLLCSIYVAAGLLIAAVSYPLVRGWIGPNAWYGFRTPTTLSSAEAWFPANAYAGRWLLGSGVVIAVAAIALRLMPAMRLETYAYAMLAVTVLCVTTSLVQSFRFLRRL